MTAEQGASRSSILKEPLEVSPSHFEDIDLYDWNEEDKKEDDKKRRSRHHHHRPHHDHPVLPPSYYQSPTPAAQPPPYTRSIFTGIAPATKRWLIALTVSLIVLIVTLILVVTLAVHPPAQQAPPPPNATLPIGNEPQLAPTFTASPTSNVAIAVVTATEVKTITAAANSISPIPTSMVTATRTEAFQSPVQDSASNDGNVAAGASETVTPA
ncbi:hypothetical protein MMC10_007894 [Thelotrema lepadinum]|nr:hypothetical protein [Thelotrema lepadinum]